MRERLHVVDQGRQAEVAHLGRERRLEPRHPAAPLHRLEHRRLLAADVRAGADHELDGQAARGDRLAQALAGGGVLLTEVDEGVLRLAEAHRGGEPFEEELRPQLHHVTILDRSGLSLVRVHDHDARAGLSSHGIPLLPGREPCPAHPGQTGGLEPRDHLVLREERRLHDLVGLEQEAVRRVGDAAAHLVAVEDDRREIAMAEAGHLERIAGQQLARARAVADGPRADADRVDGHLEERVERDDLVHLAAADVHVVGERVRELGPDRPDLAAQPAEVVEQARPLRRQRLEDGRESEDVHASSLRLEVMNYARFRERPGGLGAAGRGADADRARPRRARRSR